MQIDFSKHVLDNGLQVIVHEDHDLPIVAVNVWYHVGSKNERPGRTGFAHLFEHLMFEGSAHYNRGFFPPLQEAGASLNGSTNADRTNYWEVVPTNALELALWLESDRMGYLRPALTDHKFNTQREVVLNERRQNYENRPYGMASLALLGALYLPDHPYHWPTIGFPEDLRAASLKEVHEFFEQYYRPSNASLTLAGDIDATLALELVREYFEEIPAGSGRAPAVVPPPTQRQHEPRLLLEDRVELPRLYLAWPSPALFADGDAPMDLVANVLAGGKTSRLYRLLVHERRLALDVSAYQQSRELDGIFQVAVTAAPGVSLAAIDSEVQDTILAVGDGGPDTNEMARGLAQAEANFVYRLQTVGGFSGKSDQLNAYNVFVSNPGFFEQDLERYRRLTSEDVRRAAGALTPQRRVALSVVPMGRQDLALKDSEPAVVR